MCNERKEEKFAYLECWKVLKEELKFMLIIKPMTPSDEGIPAIILTDNGKNIAGETEAVTLTSKAQ